ncbi:glycosyltransferase 8 domain-containing protein 1-like [Babylonia areolata]|uniref:glycosyltransferase 8 domain-containing protein 1-like n=1 Tax=Babylonia areolata TaxID=304850 RepID=UPI003FD0FE85
MAMSNIKKVVLLLFIVWLATLSYIWLPGIIPDFLHIRGKLFSQKDQKLKDNNATPNRALTGGSSSSGSSNTSHIVAAKQKGEKRAVHVVISSENSRLGGMVALINSIVSNAKSTVFFHLITDQESSEHLKTWLMRTKLQSINYEIVEFPQEWVASKIGFRGTRTELANPMNYARYYLPYLLPHVDGKIVYIDDDCIVQDDLAELYNMKMKPGTLAAFAEDCQGMNKRINFMQNVYADYFDVKNKHFKELNIKPTACAFNAGVFVTDLGDWRRHNITQQLEHWLELNSREELYGNERGGGGAQPPMMLVFYNKYTPIDQLWHVHFLGWTARSSYSRQFIQRAKLLHWSGRFKPWGRTAAFQSLWDLYYLPDPTKEFLPLRKGIL